MKKVKSLALLIIFLSILILNIINVNPVNAAIYYSDIRVKLSIEETESMDINIVGNYYLKENPSFVLRLDTATISKEENKLVITSDDNTFTASTITLMSRDYSGTSATIALENGRYGECTYLGNMAFSISNGNIRAINTVPLENYLYGVVPYEMSNTFPMEALKVQAICARGYAITKCAKSQSRDYDIIDTPSDQVYHGYVSEYSRAIAAVNETKGKVITYNGKIIPAYYSASNGGQTELAGNAWANNFPYYTHQDDHYDIENPHSLEEKSFIPESFTTETVPSMDSVVLTKLQKQANKEAGEDVVLLSVVRIKPHTAVYNPPSHSYTMADVVLMVAKKDGTSGQLDLTLNLDDLVYSKENKEGIFNTEKPSLRVRGAEEGTMSIDDNTFDGWFLTNRRYGHGVGMSQRGAQQRATAGQDFQQILDFYYVNTKVYTVDHYEPETATLTSNKYRISSNGISKIAVNTVPEELLSNIKSSNGDVSIISANGNKKMDGIIATGDFVRMKNNATSVTDLPVVIVGDVDGDGKIINKDLDALQKHLLGTARLTGAYFSAADINHDNEIDSQDVLCLMKQIHGTYTIEQ